MFGKLFLKEWKDKLSLFFFPFIGMAIIAIVFLAFAEEKSDLSEYLYGGLIYVYLPLTALLIGASGFQSEFKNDAWAYLFSRPVQRWQIWLVKYLALLSIFIAVLLVFFLVILIIPQFSVSSGIFEPYIEILENGLTFAHWIFLSFSAFTISFCLSFIVEKTYIILLTSIFLAVGLVSIFYVFSVFLSTLYPFESGMERFIFFIPVAFVAASFLTFIRTDFTQVKKKVLVFSGILSALIVMSLGVNTVWTLNSYSYHYYADGFQKYEDWVYIGTEKGIFRYHPEQDRLKAVKKMRLLELEPFVRGGKIAFVKYKSRRCRTSELWVMEADGSQKKLLLERPKEEQRTPYYGDYYHPIGSIMLSPDGNRIAFIEETQKFIEREEETYKYTERKKEFAVSWMNSDGTELKSKSLDFGSFENACFLAWPEFEDSLFIYFCSDNLGKIIKFNLENSAFHILGEYNINWWWWRDKNVEISPQGDLIAIHFYDEEIERRILSILDLRTLEKRDVFEANTIEDIRWNDRGDRLGFVSDKKLLWVYDLSENNAKKVSELAYYYQVWNNFFVFSARKLAAFDFIDGTKIYLQVFGEDFSEEKSVEIPFSSKYYFIDFAAGFNNSLFLWAEGRKTELWRFDLNTEEWRKIYPR
jgi:ABC-type transport system involved in multi-copper enzyme maturation permease subunit